MNRCKRQRLVDGEDRISNLPQNIIGYILSFLPTKEAVRTCILSTKWIYNWTFMIHLHFDDSWLSSQKQKKSKKAHFVNFVDRAVRLLADSSVKSFCLRLLCHNNYEPCQVNEWVSAILEARLQRLHICYAEQVLFSSHSLFTCSTLVQLVLWVNCSLTLPASVCLPNLIYLSFSRITFASDSSAHSTDIILSFPALREFETRDCVWLTEQDVSI
ncbi:hypothetical protein L6164_022729 [Bauhinia variegata]|uniref:Uncharacterized protein n=1 Tax=Bauhinia variegata TaxID=167791 RepID=A0ACB9MHZ2_BAUVA|nr:hypothetical protein L6164_022729 [Bauhinia variegata]